MNKDYKQTINIQVGVCLWAFQVLGVQVHRPYYGIVWSACLCKEGIHQISVDKSGVSVHGLVQECACAWVWLSMVNSDWGETRCPLTPEVSLPQQEAVEDQRISVTYIPTEENIADIFMKARPKFMQLVGKLGLRKILKKGKEFEGSTR